MESAVRRRSGGDIETLEKLAQDHEIIYVPCHRSDFSMPERFGLTYVGADGDRHTPVMLHRACYGSLERFLGIIIENYAAAFQAA